MKRSEDWIFVRNNSDEEFTNRFNGEDFSIQPGEYEEMPVAAAALVFGFGEEDKTRALRRLGWGATHNDLKKAESRLHKFSFHMTEAEAKTGPKKKASDTNSAIPLPGSEEGAAKVSPEAAPNALHAASVPGQTNLLHRAASRPAA